MSADETKPPEKLLKDVESYDKKELKHIEAAEKTPSQARDLTMAGNKHLQCRDLFTSCHMCLFMIGKGENMRSVCK